MGMPHQPARQQQLAPLSVHGGSGGGFFGTPSNNALAQRPHAGAMSALTEAERRLDNICAKSDSAMAQEEREARELRAGVAALRQEREDETAACERMRAALNEAAKKLESVRASATAKDEALTQRQVSNSVSALRLRVCQCADVPETRDVPSGAACGTDGEAPGAAGGRQAAHGERQQTHVCHAGARSGACVPHRLRQRKIGTRADVVSSRCLHPPDACVRRAALAPAATSSWRTWRQTRSASGARSPCACLLRASTNAAHPRRSLVSCQPRSEVHAALELAYAAQAGDAPAAVAARHEEARAQISALSAQLEQDLELHAQARATRSCAHVFWRKRWCPRPRCLIWRADASMPPAPRRSSAAWCASASPRRA